MKRKGGKAPRNPKEPVVRAAFARVLADLREKAGLTQGQVAEKSGYEEKYIGALERRKHTPTLTAVIQISNAVNVSPLQTVELVLEIMPKFRPSGSKVLMPEMRLLPASAKAFEQTRVNVIALSSLLPR